MTESICYENLADALNSLPNGYPRTESGVEIRILEKIFTPEEAILACQLSREYETVETIAQRIGLAEEQTRHQLFQMAKRGLVWFSKEEGKAFFRLAPFVVGIYEAQLEILDAELAGFAEEYFKQDAATGIMKPQPALHRVLPAQNTVADEWILPYEDVRAILLSAQVYNVRDCICRAQKGLIDDPCEYPREICLNFSNIDRPPRPGDISRPEALALLEKSEQVGLVHTVSNVKDGVGYICNCCSCCCVILRAITENGILNSVAHANYFAVIDGDICSNCGTCVERCQVNAISEGDGISVVERVKCIGCGLCVTGCTTGAARLERKPEAEIIHPPADFATWEIERLRNRGLAD
ncbi:MAG: 4Fe-4S binding protein [Chloroflexota bacterium]